MFTALDPVDSVDLAFKFVNSPTVDLTKPPTWLRSWLRLAFCQAATVGSPAGDEVYSLRPGSKTIEDVGGENL